MTTQTPLLKQHQDQQNSTIDSSIIEGDVSIPEESKQQEGDSSYLSFIKGSTLDRIYEKSDETCTTCTNSDIVASCNNHNEKQQYNNQRMCNSLERTDDSCNFTQACEVRCHELPTMFALPFMGTSSPSNAEYEGLPYDSCNAMGGSCDQMFSVQSNRSCEYCFSKAFKCKKNCERPELYFSRRKPPFASDEGRDAKGYKIIATSASSPTITAKNGSNRKEVPRREGSWMSSLFVVNAE